MENKDVEVSVRERTPASDWWSNLSINTKDAIQKTAFINMSFSVEMAYTVFGTIVK